MPDSSDIDNALIAKLSSDSTLLGYMPNGVYWDEAPPGSTRFVIVSLVDAHDERMFEARAIEDTMYMVKAVALSTTSANMKAAAARIDELLDPQPPLPPPALVVPGYSLMAIYRDQSLPRIRETEPDDVDASIRWYHRGGHYHVVMST